MIRDDFDAVIKRLLADHGGVWNLLAQSEAEDRMTYGSSIPDDFKGILSQPARDKPVPLSASQLQKILDESPHVVPLADGTYYLLPGNLKRKD